MTAAEPASIVKLASGLALVPTLPWISINPAPASKLKDCAPAIELSNTMSPSPAPVSITVPALMSSTAAANRTSWFNPAFAAAPPAVRIVPPANVTRFACDISVIVPAAPPMPPTCCESPPRKSRLAMVMPLPAPVVLRVMLPPAPPLPAALADPLVMSEPRKSMAPTESIVMAPALTPGVNGVVLIDLPASRFTPPAPALMVTRPLSDRLASTPAVVRMFPFRSTV